MKVAKVLRVSIRVASAVPPSSSMLCGVLTGGRLVGTGSLSASWARYSATSNPMPPAPMTATDWPTVAERLRTSTYLVEGVRRGEKGREGMTMGGLGRWMGDLWR